MNLYTILKLQSGKKHDNYIITFWNLKFELTLECGWKYSGVKGHVEKHFRKERIVAWKIQSSPVAGLLCWNYY